MNLTEYLKLILTGADEVSMTFLEWRTLMNGVTGNSNMEIIDRAIGELQTKKADGFTLDPETGELQLTSGGEPLEGEDTKITINLAKYYTKEEVDGKIQQLEENLADNDALQEMRSAAVGDIEWTEDSRTMTLYDMNGEIKKELTIEGGGGGTGGGTGHSVRIINGMTSTTITSASSSPTVLKASFYEYYGSEATGQSGTLAVDYKLSTDSEWTSFKTGQVVQQGVEFEVDVTNILTVGKTTNVRLTVTGGESGVSRALTFNVASVEASIAAVNFDSSSVYTGNVSLQYRCLGRNLQKTVHVYIDGKHYLTENIGTSHNETRNIQITMLDTYDYGAHDVELYFDTPDGAMSNVVKLVILYNDGASNDTMIGVICDTKEITYGDTLTVNFVAYTPGQEATDGINITIYSLDDEGERVPTYHTVLNGVENGVNYTWQGSAFPVSGTAYIEFACGDTVKTISVEVHEIEIGYEIDPITTSLVYHYSPAGRSNNDDGKEVYAYDYTTVNGVNTKIKGVNEGFNWVSDGYADGECLKMAGSARHTIELPIFAASYTDDEGQTVNLESSANAQVTTNGRTIEMEFSVESVTDQNAPIIKCMNDAHAGFLVTPQVCYLLASNGTNVALDETGFIENEESIPAAYIKDEKRIRLAFVIEPVDTLNGRQCVNIYINGEFANSKPYNADSVYRSTELITFGSDSCITKLYDVRIYNRGLTTNEIRQNYMVSPIAVQDKIARLEDNDVLTDDGDVSYEKARVKYPCLLIIGEFSPYKGSKKKCGAILTKPDGNGGYTTEFQLLDKDADGNYVSDNNVQGTSSQKFMRKNYKLAMKYANYGEDGAFIESKKFKYSLKGKDAEGHDLSIPESTLCYKIDYMSTDHGNTFNANLADTLFADTTDAQQEDPRVQNTIWGFRCLLFRTDAATYPNGVIEFAGDGALNNDKGNNATFGLECDGDEGNVTKRQKWEFLNNTNSICFFKSDTLMKVIDQDATIYNKEVVNALESTYPDQGDLEDEGLEPNYDYIQVLYTWVCQRANFWNASTATGTTYTYNGKTYHNERDYRKAIFVNEFSRHFNMEHAMTYYVFMEFVALCDNRAKNMFLRCEDVTVENLVFTDSSVTKLSDIIDPQTGAVDADKIDWENSTFAIWLTDLYDLDSCFGAENSGYIRIPYYADWDYALKGANQFNGYDSWLWLMVEDAFFNEIKAKAQSLTSQELLCYESLYDAHIKNNAMMICPAVINRDMEHKYSDPWTVGYIDYSAEGNPYIYTSGYKYLQRGSRTEQKEAFIYRRSHMLYSKYQCDQYRNNSIHFRAGQYIEAANSAITMTASQAMYHGVKYGDTGTNIVASGKIAAGVPHTIVNTQRIGRSDTVFLYGGTDLTDIGDISAFYPYEINLTKATKLKNLKIGSDTDGYQNTSLSSLDLSACTLLETLNVMGCVSLENAIDLSGNNLIRKVYAGNSIIPYIKLPNGGVLEELHVGAVNNLTVLNQTNLTEFTYDSLGSLTCLRIENTPNIPIIDILEARLAHLTDGIRLVGIDLDIGDDMSLLEMLISDAAKGKYLDNNGILSTDENAYPQITGTIHCNAIGSYLLGEVNRLYPQLTIDYQSEIVQYRVQFVNDDGTVLDTQYVMMGGAAIDPTTRAENPIPTPTKASDAQYVYTFSGWDANFTVITGALTVTAQYSTVTRTYTVNWYLSEDESKTPLLTKTGIEYGSSVVYDGDTPVDISMEQYLMYRIFRDWDQHTGFIVDDMNVHAIFDEAVAPKLSDNKTLGEMTTAELNALVVSEVLASNGGLNANSSSGDYYGLITSGDEIDMILGHDYDYDNVESIEVIPLDEPEIFDGTNHVDTGIKLFDEDKSFVVAIDFAFTATTVGAVLASCCAGNTGFKLQYGSNASSILHSGTASANVSASQNREMVVIRHRKGDNNLYVYASDKENSNQVVSTIVRTLPCQHESTLAFGCAWDSRDSYGSNFAKGKINWAKVWLGDLGEDLCKNLAAWPRETQTIQAVGNENYRFRMFQLTDSGLYSNCCFLLKDLMSVTHRMNATSTNAGGWDATEMRTWLNDRVYKAIPEQWKRIMKRVNVISTAGNMSTTEFVTSEDMLFLPSNMELNLGNGAGYGGESNAIFNIFTTNEKRIKKMNNGEGAASYWWTRSPGTGLATHFIDVNNNGGGYDHGAHIQYGVCFGFCI